ncbi:hypothetical protein [Cytobacillus oceanisediminis]|uniref:hypothetical protein n=1 Tax=Cytobacillus oceanisediminis TaxID=665099 RepID=UPI001C24335A|nr:hypothetical protein [Cytobacillus oceanisediminis]MBU8771597.1 hypothetical protein [Cytobacillus oceanisediminis]
MAILLWTLNRTFKSMSNSLIANVKVVPGVYGFVKKAGQMILEGTGLREVE